MTRYLISSILCLGFLPMIAQAAYTNIAISTTNSLRLDADANNALLGSSAVAVGDTNNDGYDDWLLGTYTSGSTRDDAYLVYGSASRATATGSTAMSASNIAKLLGTAGGGYSGAIVGAAGDVDGDGYTDILVGAPFQSSTKGEVYLVYGSATAYSGSNNLSTVGITFTGEAAADYLGYALGSADINNDGYSDILIGSRSNSGGKGALYIIYGQSTRFTSVGITSVVDSKFQGATANDNFGSAIANAGDVNNDGYDDIIVGAPRYSTYTGATYLIYGQQTEFSGIGTISINNSAVFEGEQTYDSIGYSLAGAGDVDGDGYDDWLIGATEQSTDPAINTIADGAYIVYGQSDVYSGTTNVNTLPKFTTETSSDSVTYTVAGGDVNNDGYSDIAIGLKHQESSAGAVYLLLGSATRYASTSVANANYRLLGGGMFGSTTAVTNNNNDAAMDLLVGSAADNSVYTNGGSVSVIRPFIDGDNDGTPGSSGLISGSDCSDSDATVSTNQTYYLDSDGDGYGSTTTTSSCTSTPPTGYVDNDDDCNDADGTIYTEQTYYQDNDGDGLGVTDTTTLSCTSTAPSNYADNTNDTDDTISFADHMVGSVIGAEDGTIVITYNDSYEATYNIFTLTSSRVTIAAQYPESNLVVVVHPRARQIALVDGLTGTIHSQKILNTTAHSKVTLLVKDLRTDGKYEALVVAKRGTKIVHVHLFSIQVAKLKLKKRDDVTVKSKTIVPSKTTAKKQTVRLRTSAGKIVEKYTVNKQYRLVH